MRLEAERLCKSYGRRKVLRDISYTFEGGKLYVVKGVSGCGKTTLLNILGGVEKDFEGKVTAQHPLRVGCLFQKSLLLSSMTVRENLALIRPDEERIRTLCTLTGVEDLMERTSEQLSGGERQRISVVRALLRDPELLLCDEPTASLDGENSKLVAKLIAEQENADRIIIVATHDDYFDDLADVILRLDYGALIPVVIRESTGTHSEDVAGSRTESVKPGKIQRITSFRYALRRHPKLLTFGSLFPLVFGFLLILILSTVQNSFSSEYMRILRRSYPTDLIFYYKSNGRGIPEPYLSQTTFYDDIRAEEDGVVGLYLPRKRASVLIAKGLILFGAFPEKPEEVLASPEYAEDKFPGIGFAEVVGKQIRFCGLDLTIAGIIASDKDPAVRLQYNYDLYYHAYYRERSSHEVLLIPYETIRQIGTVYENDAQSAAFPDLAETEDALAAVREMNYGNYPNQYYQNVVEAQKKVNIASRIITLLIIVCTAVACAFMVSVVSLELYFRKKELGYLQIFGVERRRVAGLVFAEYLLKSVAALWTALGIYALFIITYRLVFGVWVLPEIAYTGLLTIIILGAYLLTANLSIRRFLRKSVIDLIR
ncbi:MAG: ATP-binding cassette domain-containing protein [Lachnospiraceae bacterium]|nr:ATP-binding cassette domain-containing protein [Lachnospiraceae bacterium]